MEHVSDNKCKRYMILMFKKQIVEGLQNQHVDDRKVLVTRIFLTIIHV